MTIVDVSRRIRQTAILRDQTWIWKAARPTYRFMLRTLSNLRGIDRVINGRRYRWRYPYSEFNSDFEEPVLRVFEDRVRPGSVVLDIGASFGLYTVVAGRRVGAAGRVFAFEPSRVAETLTDHLRLNSLVDRVEVIQSVVTDEVGRIDFWEGDDTMFSSVVPTAATRGSPAGRAVRRRALPTTTIDVFCISRTIIPDVVKSDVEGAEARVLRGAEEFLRHRSGSIFLEVHPSVLNELGETYESLNKWLESRGWSGTQLYSRGDAADSAATLHLLYEPRESMTRPAL